MRPTLITDNGRTLRGTSPETMSLTYCGEAPFIHSLAMQVHGLVEVAVPCGRADVATGTDVWEVEPIGRWREGVRQAFAYGGLTGLRPHVAIYGAGDYLRLYMRIRDTMPGLGLWGHHPDLGWRHLTSRAEAVRKVVA